MHTGDANGAWRCVAVGTVGRTRYASALRQRTDPMPLPPTDWTPDQLRAIEASRLRALVERDMPLAWRLHAPDFQLVTPGGSAFTRAEYLDKIERGVLRYLRWEPGEMAVRMRSDSAVIRYQATLELDGGDGHGTAFRCWHIDSYELNDNGAQWQVVWSQATAVR